jgi:hypothetical protein
MLFAVLLVSGCSQSPEPSNTDERRTPEDSPYLLSAEPAGARDIIDVRKNVKDGEAVVIKGQIGGQTKPFISGEAAFFLVDLSLEPCGDEECGWDFCSSADELPGARVLVEIVDDSGKTVAKDAKKAFGVKELSKVVVKGKVSKDDKGNVTIVGTGLYVRK